MEPGTLFAGKYLIERMLGRGGFSAVYLATEIELERPVALKVLLPERGGSQRFEVMKERFFREARTLSKLQDAQSVRLYHYGEAAEQRLYMALEYVNGFELRELIEKQGGVEVGRALRIVEQIFLGLREVHSLGILHRDIKPNNIMITERFGEEYVKLLDFGIAKNITLSDENLTQEGAVIGTPRYLAPEQILGEPLSSATDIYAVGLVFYELCLGQSPHEDTNLTTIYGRMEALPHKIKDSKVFPEEIKPFFRRCLSLQSSERFEDVQSALNEVRAILSDCDQWTFIGGSSGGAGPQRRANDSDFQSQEVTTIYDRSSDQEKTAVLPDISSEVVLLADEVEVEELEDSEEILPRVTSDTLDVIAEKPSRRGMLAIAIIASVLLIGGTWMISPWASQEHSSEENTPSVRDREPLERDEVSESEMEAVAASRERVSQALQNAEKEDQPELTEEEEVSVEEQEAEQEQRPAPRPSPRPVSRPDPAEETSAEGTDDETEENSGFVFEPVE